MESPLAQRMERLWMSLLMIVVSSSAFRRSPLPPKASCIEADWSKRKMKQPGFFRLISALYILPPFVCRLLQVEFVGEFLAPARRARSCGFPFGDPLQAARTALQEFFAQHRVGTKLVRKPVVRRCAGCPHRELSGACARMHVGASDEECDRCLLL